MILHVYATKNKKSGQFGKPSVEVLDEKEIKESYTCSFLEAPEDQKVYLRELDVYKLGEYNTETGEIVADIVYLMDLGSLDGKGKEASV